MKPQERLEAVFAFEEPDRVPICEKLRNEAVIGHYAGEPFVPERGMELTLTACQAILDCTMKLDYPQPESIETSDDGIVWHRDRWTTWIERRPFSNVSELSAWAQRDIDRLNAFTPDASWWAPRLAERERYQAQLGETAYLFKDAQVGLTETYFRAGLELFAYLMTDDPPLISRWLEAAFQASLRILAALDLNRIPCRIAHIGEDIGTSTSTLFSPDFLRAEFFPRLQTLVAAYHDLGFKVIYHSDGNLNRIMDELVATGIDGLDPIEVLAGMDLADLKEKYGKQLVLMGGMDASKLLPRGTADEVRAATLAALKAAAPGSGYILRSTTEISNAVPMENVLAMWETMLEHGRYPLRLN